MIAKSKKFFLGSEFFPQLILIEEQALHYPYCGAIKKRLDLFRPEYIVVKNEQEALEVLKKKKKRHLYLGVNRGSFLRRKFFGKDCESVEKTYCLDHITGCHFACVYCYLHSYLKNNPLVRIAVNIEDMLKELDAVWRQEKAIFVSTGELSDSLLFEPITQLSRHMIPFLKKRSSIVMEFRSKSSYIGFLKKIKPVKNVCFTWTLSPQKVVKEYEFKTASLMDRIRAIDACQRAGFSTGIIIDPMIHYEGWKKDYLEMIHQITRGIDLRKIDRLFVGSFRYRKKMDEDIQKKFPKTRLFTGEFILARDGKYRYYKPIREEMYRWVRDGFLKYGRSISLSMEFPETWSKVIKKS